MSTLHLVSVDLRERYHVKEWRNAAGVLATTCPAEWQDVQDVLRGFRLLKSEPINFEDDGPEALAALKERMAAEKRAKKTARRQGPLVPDDEDEDNEEG